MRIVKELKEKIFKESSDFLSKLANEWHNINANILDYYGQRNYELVFLGILTEEIHQKLPDYKVVPSVKLNRIPGLHSEDRAEKVLGMRLEELRVKVCTPAYIACRRHTKCFQGEWPNGTEVDALIIRDEDFCFLEYEEKRQALCDNFMKMYRLHKLLNKKLECLFVTKVTTKLSEKSTTFNRFNEHIDEIRTILDTLLQDWAILEIVDLYSEKRRRFHWRP